MIRSWLTPDTAPETTSPPAAAATPGRRISAISERIEVRGASGAGSPARFAGGLPEPSASGTTTSAATAAINRNGTAMPARCARIPPTAGPTITPTEEQVTDGPSRPPLVPVSTSESHAMPVVHTTPNATPKTIRPLTSSTSDGAACSRHAEHSSAPAASVARRAPNRSATSPAGTETASVASPGSASSSAVSDGVRS